MGSTFNKVCHYETAVYGKLLNQLTILEYSKTSKHVLPGLFRQYSEEDRQGTG
jgi:hypothetical protein